MEVRNGEEMILEKQSETRSWKDFRLPETYGHFCKNQRNPFMSFNQGSDMTDFHLAQFHCPLTNWMSCWSTYSTPELIYSFHIKKFLLHQLFHLSFYPYQIDHAGFLEKIGSCSPSLQSHTSGKHCHLPGSNVRKNWQRLFPQDPSVPGKPWTTSYGSASGRTGRESGLPYTKTMTLYCYQIHLVNAITEVK